MSSLLHRFIVCCALLSPAAAQASPSPLRWSREADGAAGAMPVRWAAAGKQSQSAQPKATRGFVPAGGVCRSDQECAAGTYCDYGKCVVVERPFNALYLYYRSGDRRFTEILGIYWHRAGERGYRVLFPLYWQLWSKDEVTVFVLPFQYRRTPNERNYRVWPLFFWTDYGERGSGITLMPLFHRAREGTRTATAIPLFLSGYNIDPPRRRSQGLVLGLYYWNTDGISGERSQSVTPLFYRRTGPRSSFAWVLPLNFFWRERSARDLERGALILPFYYHRSARASATGLALLPPVYYHRAGAARRLLVPPLYFARGDDATGTGYRVLFPLYWHVRSPRRALSIWGPWFYRHDRVRGDKLALFFPLLYYRSEEHGLRARVVSPYFLYQRDADAGVTHWGVIAPPIYSRRDVDREVDLVLPLGLRWYDKNERSTTWVLGPLAWNRDPDGGSQILFPIFWRFKDARTGAATSILFPLAYRHRRPDGSHYNLLFPFFFSRRADGWSAGAYPLLYFGRSRASSHAVLFPALLHVRTRASTTTVVGPIFHQRLAAGGWRAGVAPLFFAGSALGERYHVLFPALWHLASAREGWAVHLAGPIFYARHRGGRLGGLFPIFAAGTWRDTRFATVIPPLFYHGTSVDRDPRRRRSKTLAALYYGWEDPEERGHLLFPLFLHRRAKDGGLRTGLLPLFYYRSRGDGQLLVTPAGGYRRSADGTSLKGLVGPVAFNRSRDVRGFAIVPLVYHWTRVREEGNATTTVVLPLGVRHVSPELRAFVWFPLVWRLADREQSSLVLFPLFWHQRERGGLDADVVFPLFWRLRGPRRSVLVAGPAFYERSREVTSGAVVPLFYYRRDERRSTLVALPFIWRQRDFARGERRWVVGPGYLWRYPDGASAGLVPLFFHKRRADSHYTILLPVIWHVADPRAGTRTTVVGPFFYRRRGDARSFGVAPIIYGAWDRAGGRSAALLPLFYTRREVARFALYTPLGGADLSPGLRQWYAGPFFRRRTPAAALDILLPLFARHRDHARGRTTLALAPVYFGRWSAERALHILFPIVWRYRRVDEAGTVVFPFVWDFNDRFAARTTVLFPIFMRHRDHRERTTSYVVPPLWLRTRPAANDAVFFPLLWHFGGKQRSTTLALPLYYDVNRGPAKRTTMLFPFFLRLDRGTERSYYVLPNTMYRNDRRRDLFRFLFLPLVDVHRKRAGDIHVEFIFGIVGYERVGKNRFLTIFFYTFPLEPAGPKTLSGFGGAGQQTRMWSDPLW